MDPLISVIVPIYNAEKYLKECIESILRQTYKNIQLILINDGSTDKSLDICNHYKKMDKRILVIDKLNSGVSSTRNQGIRMAKGDYIGFVDSDDYIEENMYEILLNKIIHDKSELCAMTPYTINSFDLDNNVHSLQSVSSLNALKNLFVLKFPTSLWAYLYSRRVLENLYLNEEIHFFEDFEFNFRVLSEVDRVSLCNNKLYNYRINEGSINSQEINEKRITCLNIYSLITDKIQRKYLEIQEYVPHFRAHFLSAVIISAIKSEEVKEKYFRIIGKESRNLLKFIFFSKYVPFKYKLAITTCSINPKILYWLMFFYRIK